MIGMQGLECCWELFDWRAKEKESKWAILNRLCSGAKKRSCLDLTIHEGVSRYVSEKHWLLMVLILKAGLLERGQTDGKHWEVRVTEQCWIDLYRSSCTTLLFETTGTNDMYCLEPCENIQKYRRKPDPRFLKPKWHFWVSKGTKITLLHWHMTTPLLWFADLRTWNGTSTSCWLVEQRTALDMQITCGRLSKRLYYYSFDLFLISKHFCSLVKWITLHNLNFLRIH